MASSRNQSPVKQQELLLKLAQELYNEHQSGRSGTQKFSELAEQYSRLVISLTPHEIKKAYLKFLGVQSTGDNSKDMHITMDLTPLTYLGVYSAPLKMGASQKILEEKFGIKYDSDKYFRVMLPTVTPGMEGYAGCDAVFEFKAD